MCGHILYEEGLTYSVWSYLVIDGGVYELGTAATDPSESLALLTTITPRNELMPLPLTFEDTWSSDYMSVTKINGMTFNTSTVNQAAVADAYGTLILPDGSSQEALRIKVIETDGDGSSTSFLFVAKNGAFFAVEAGPGSGDEGTITITGANYHSGSTQTSVEEAETALAPSDITTFPNPAASSTTLRYDLSQPGSVELAVFNANGQVVLRTASTVHSAGTYMTQIPCTELVSGIYTVRISINGSTADHTFVVQR